METIEKNILTEEVHATSTRYSVKSQTSFLPLGTSDVKLKFIVSRDNIEVRLTNETPVSALRFEIEFRNRFVYRPITLTERVQNLNSYINFQETSLTFVLLDIDGKGISSGEGTIIDIPIDDQQEFQVTAAYASTRTSGIKEIGHTIVNENIRDFIILEQNDPNPFSTSTKIEFQITDDAEVKVVIYDVGGALIRTLLDSKLKAGKHELEWDGKNDSGSYVESGIYLYKLYAGIYCVTRKMVYLK